MVKVTIDGITVEVPESATILQAAMKAGVDIPYFCYHPYLKPAGLCRMCLVEVEGMPKLVPACVTQVRDGMVVRTDTERVKKAREGIIEFQLLHHPLDCPICDQAGECMLQDITFRYGKTTSRFYDEKELYPTKFYGPLIVHEQSRCILCKRCVRFCTEVLNGADWNVYWRAAHSIIGSYEKDVVANYFTGNLVEVCPVGAITSRLYRYKTRIWKLEFTRSVCDHCELGCSLDLGVRENQLFKVKHNAADPTPWICDKGYYAFDYVNHSERITYPLKRNGDKMVSISVDDAVKGIAEALGKYGEGEIAFVISPYTVLEDGVAVKCLAERVSGLLDYRVYGESYLPVKTEISDISQVGQAKGILVLCADVGNTHPVLALSMLQARSAGSKVAVISANDTFLGERSDAFALVPAGKEERIAASLLNGQIPDGLDLSEDEVAVLRELLASDDLLVVLGPRASAGLRRLALDVCQGKGWKALLLDRGSNFKGLYAIGATNASVGDILEGVASGKVKGLVVFGVDLLATYPDRDLVKKALEVAEFVAVGDLFFHETACYADYFLPLVSFAEDGGTVVDLFWNTRRRRRAMEPAGDSQSIRGWITKIAEAMGYSVDIGLDEFSPEQVETPELSGELVEESGSFVALVEEPFYRSARYAGWCSNYSEAAGVPRAVISPEDAASLGVVDGDKVLVSSGSGSFEFVAVLREGQPKGSVVLDGGFDNFPVNALLKGRWIASVDLKKV